MSHNRWRAEGGSARFAGGALALVVGVVAFLQSVPGPLSILEGTYPVLGLVGAAATALGVHALVTVLALEGRTRRPNAETVLLVLMAVTLLLLWVAFTPSVAASVPPALLAALLAAAVLGMAAAGAYLARPQEVLDALGR